MKISRLIIILTLLLLVVLPFTVYAHSGGTDAQGGHRSPDGYHYHHGKPAHQHINDVCLYDVFEIIMISLPWVIIYGSLAYLAICSKLEQWKEKRKQRQPRRISAVTVVAVIVGIVAVFLVGAGIYDISHRNVEADPLFVAAMLIMGVAIVAAVVAVCVLKKSGNLTDDLYKKKLDIKKKEKIAKIMAILAARIQEEEEKKGGGST